MSKSPRNWSGFRLFTTCLALAVGLAVVLVGCSGPVNPWEGLPGNKHVAVSFAPLWCFTKEVAGDDCAVLSILTTDGPHDYDYGPKDVVPLRKADLFLINGLNLDEFAVKLKNSANKDLKMVELAEAAIPEKQLINVDRTKTDHYHGPKDPHVWLGPPEAILMVKKIVEELKALDPEHADNYQKRGDAYVKRLEALHEYGKEKFKDKKHRGFISFHDSLRYFARAFDLEIVGVIEPHPNVEPDAVKVKNLAELANEKTAPVVATEPQYNTGPAKTLLDLLKRKGLTDAQAVVIDPLETTGSKTITPDWYEAKMRENIDNLAKAMQ